MNLLTIRRMQLIDVPVVHAIDVLSFSLPWPERSFRHEVTNNPASRCWVAESGTESQSCIVGMLVLWLIEDEAHIATLAVHPEQRRQGIGERILLSALQAAKSEGARRAYLEVRASNTAAQSMYDKYGFSLAGRRPGYYKDNSEDAILLTLENLNDLPEEA
ncbi:MAG: ribosomal protein S18-alanine N-acetyltransferase [Chloroflexota bacterium]